MEEPALPRSNPDSVHFPGLVSQIAYHSDPEILGVTTYAQLLGVTPIRLKKRG